MPSLSGNRQHFITNDFHYCKSAGTGPVVLNVAWWTGASYSVNPMDQFMCAWLFLHLLLVQRAIVYARMIPAKGIRMPGSKEANLFRRFYRILYVSFLPSVGNTGWSITVRLKITKQRLQLPLCQLSHAWTIYLWNILQRSRIYRYYIWIRVSRHFGLVCTSRADQTRRVAALYALSVAMPHVWIKIIVVTILLSFHALESQRPLDFPIKNTTIVNRGMWQASCRFSAALFRFSKMAFVGMMVT